MKTVVKQMQQVQPMQPMQPAQHVPDYWEEAKQQLMQRDRIMARLIPQFGDVQLTGKGEPFSTLVRSVISQQISDKSAEAVWLRFMALCPKCSPSQVLKAGAENLAGCGLSKRKTEYILDLAEHFKAKRVHVDQYVYGVYKVN